MTPTQEQSPGGLMLEILTELNRARAKFAGENVTFAALVEEIGETATALFEEPRANVRKEAIQVAVMAMRLILDGDHTLDAWRAARGLDPLTGPGGERPHIQGKPVPTTAELAALMAGDVGGQ